MDLSHYEYGGWRKIEVSIHNRNDLEKIAGLFCDCVWSVVSEVKKTDDPELLHLVNDVLDSYRTHSTEEVIELMHDFIALFLKDEK